MFGIPLAFGAPAILGALLALPLIWWLLKLTPPRPNAWASNATKRRRLCSSRTGTISR